MFERRPLPAELEGRPDPYPDPPRPEPRADSSNLALVTILQVALGTCGCDVSHPDYDGPYRNSTFYELAEECEWSGDFLAGAHRLAEDLGLLGISTDTSEEPQHMGTDDDDVVKDFATEKAKRKANGSSPGARAQALKDDKEKKLHIIVAEVFFGKMAEVGDDLKMVKDKNNVEQMWFYDAKTSLWSLIRDEAIFLERKLQEVVIGLKSKNKSSTKLLAEARKFVMVHPQLYPANIAFDAHGLVPLKNFLIDPRTSQLTPMTREHYCTWFYQLVSRDKRRGTQSPES
jgi:hypothetical protein